MTKKIVTLLLSLLLVLNLVACGSTETPGSADTPDDTAPVVEAMTPNEGENMQTETVEDTAPALEAEIPVEEDMRLPETKNSEAAEEKEVPSVEEIGERNTSVPNAVEDKESAEVEKEGALASDNIGEPAAPQQPVHQHSYATSVTPATCTTKGYTTYTCECGHSYTADYNGGNGHSYEEVYENLPVYESVPIMRCGACHENLDDVGGVAHIKEEALAGNPGGGSSYGDTIQVLICYEDQLVGYACSVCGAER